MDVEQVIVETSLPSGATLKAVANCYRPRRALPTNIHPLILIFAHGTGFHKEHWEIPIARLFSRAAGQNAFFICEAWAIDAHTHGDSALLNKKVTSGKDWEYIPDFYADAFVQLYNTRIAPNRDPQTQVVIIGHSAGATCAALSTALYPGKAPFSALILVEIGAWPLDMTADDTPIYQLALMTIPKRRDHWASKADAYTYLKKRMPWSLWDDRILAIYVEHGIRPDLECGGVLLKCTPKEESTPFRNAGTAQGSVKAIKALDKTCTYMPVHLIYGERNDMISREKQDSLLRDGRTFMSITRVPECGHLIAQEAPDAMSDVIFGILSQVQTKRASKL